MNWDVVTSQLECVPDGLASLSTTCIHLLLEKTPIPPIHLEGGLEGVWFPPPPACRKKGLFPPQMLTRPSAFLIGQYSLSIKTQKRGLTFPKALRIQKGGVWLMGCRVSMEPVIAQGPLLPVVPDCLACVSDVITVFSTHKHMPVLSAFTCSNCVCFLSTQKAQIRLAIGQSLNEHGDLSTNHLRLTLKE